MLISFDAEGSISFETGFAILNTQKLNCPPGPKRLQLGKCIAAWIPLTPPSPVADGSDYRRTLVVTFPAPVTNFGIQHIM
jgi:hypothetical protein